jgi:hypothetical protein
MVVVVSDEKDLTGDTSLMVVSFLLEVVVASKRELTAASTKVIKSHDDDDDDKDDNVEFEVLVGHIILLMKEWRVMC